MLTHRAFFTRHSPGRHFNDSTKWLSLPRKYNVQPRLWSAAHSQGPFAAGAAGDLAVVHFVGEEKPWSALHLRPAGRRMAARKASGSERLPKELVELWRGACKAYV